MSLPLYPDGCIIPNIRTRHYVVYLAPKCEHTKVRGAYVAVDAEDADSALNYVARMYGSQILIANSVVEVANIPDTAILPDSLPAA